MTVFFLFPASTKVFDLEDKFRMHPLIQAHFQVHYLNIDVTTIRGSVTAWNLPKKKAIIQAYPLFSQAQSNIPGGDAKPKKGAGSNCIKVQIIKANFNIDKVEAIV